MNFRKIFKKSSSDASRRMKFTGTSLLLAIFSAFLLLGCGSDTIKIGVMLPLTGDAGAYGQSVKQGIDLARSQEDGAVEIELVVEDSQCTGTEAVKAMSKLATADGVVAVIGELCSSATLAAGPIANENEVVLMSPASTSPKITDAGDFVFRNIPSDSFQGVYAASIIFDAGFRKLAILHPNDDYGVGITEVLTSAFTTKAGANVVASESFERGSTDLRAQILKIKASNPDTIYLVSNSPDAAIAAIRQIEELGLDVALYGSEGVKDTELAKIPSADGLIITSVSAGSETFLSDFLAFHGGESPAAFAAQGYDAYMLLKNAVEAGARTSVEIRDYLYGNTLDGASGYLEFDENGDLKNGVYDLYVVRDGKFQITD